MATAFVGPLSRYFAREPGEAAKLRPGAAAWREDLRASVAVKIAEQLVWDEGSDVAFTSDFDAAGWMALRLLAFYADRTELELPDTVPALLELDAEWRAAAQDKFGKSKYGQLLACSVWLPGDFPVTLRVPMPDGGSAEVGSLAVLEDQMKWLNQRTFQVDTSEFAGWLGLPAAPAGDLVTAARRGYAALHAAIVVASRHGLPLVVREA